MLLFASLVALAAGLSLTPLRRLVVGESMLAFGATGAALSLLFLLDRLA